MSSIPVVPLQRIVGSSHGTLGYLLLPGARIMTFEEEDQGNRPGVSRIPAGVYRCKRRRYNKGGYDTWEVTGVPGRSLILFHVINTEEDTEGCIGVGLQVGVLDQIVDEDSKRKVPKLGVLSSRPAHVILMRRTANWTEWDLDVRDEAA
jgi:hypothetical protein